MNIIWKKPDGGVAVTYMTDEGIEVMLAKALQDGIVTEDEAQSINAACHAHADQLLARGDVPSDWAVAAVNIDLPESREWREAWTWTTEEPVIDICPARAVEVTKQRLRAERSPLLAALDVEFMRAMEQGDTERIEEIKNQKQKLRDITKVPQPGMKLQELGAISLN